MQISVLDKAAVYNDSLQVSVSWINAKDNTAPLPTALNRHKKKDTQSEIVQSDLDITSKLKTFILLKEKDSGGSMSLLLKTLLEDSERCPWCFQFQRDSSGLLTHLNYMHDLFELKAKVSLILI